MASTKRKLGMLLVLVFAQCIHALDLAGEEDSFPGWLGASYKVDPAKRPKKPSNGIDMSKVIQLSAWKPRAYLYQGFLTHAECDHIIAKANPRLERSGVVNSETGGSQLSEVRTSSGMFINKAEDKIVDSIEKRIMEWTFLPVLNQEPLQVLRYTRGQKYEPHFDYFFDPQNRQRGGHRYATVLMYLNNVTKGGETVFPNRDDPTPKDDTWSDCAKGKLAVKPRKGDALLFFSMHPDGTPDESSLHYACPVIEGVKWSAPKWIHVADFNSLYKFDSGKTTDDSVCHDSNALCGTWAAHGECKKNPIYMLDACPKSCNQCH